MDLLLDARDGRWTRDGVELALRTAITTGAITPGSPLPSTRELAAQLGVARGTVVAAVEQLAVEGLVVTRQGAATRVSAVPVPSPRATARVDPRRTPERPIADFSSGEPDLTLFPTSWWAATTRRILTSSPADVLGYGDPRGHHALRHELASYLRRTRGVLSDPDHVIVTAGFSHALAVVGRALRRHRAPALAVEDPSLWLHRQVLAASGLRVLPVPVDSEGLRVDDLPTTPGGAVLVAPAHQTPLGVTLSPGRRSQLAAWAATTGGLVIEDDYDGELRYDRRPVPALHGRDPRHVLYCGSASKTLAPGLRLGWMVVPGDLVDPVVEVIESLGGSPVSALDQLVLAELLASGRYDSHVRSVRVVYRRRRDELVRALAATVPAVRVEGVSAGLKALVRLPDGTDEASLTADLADRSIGVMPLAAFRVSPNGSSPPGIVLNFGRPYGHQYTDAVRRLAQGLADALTAPTERPGISRRAARAPGPR